MAEAQTNIEYQILVKASFADLEMLTAAKQVTETMESPGWRLIVQLLEAQKQRKLDDLIRSQQVKEPAEYARIFAEIRGYGQALLAAHTLLEEAEKAEARLNRESGQR